MRLLQFSYSPFAAKVRMGLKLKSLTCDIVNVPYTQRAELVALTGAMYVPVLVDGPTVVSDSSRIVAYLETKGGPPLCADPLSFVVEQWADEVFQETAFRYACPGLEDRIGQDQGAEARALFRLIKERRYGPGAIDQWRKQEAELLAGTLKLLSPIVAKLKTQPFVLGQAPSLADTAVASQLFMVEQAQPNFIREHAPSLGEWYARLGA